MHENETGRKTPFPMNGIAQGLILTRRKQPSWKWPIIIVLLAVTIKKNDNAIHKVQAWVVQKVDNAIHWINHYPAEGMVCFVNTYLLDSDLSGG